MTGALSVVEERNVGGWVAERRLSAFRILGEVDAVRLVDDVLVAAEEDGIEDRRTELAHAATDVDRVLFARKLAADDGTVVLVALVERPAPDDLVDGECFARHDHRSIDRVCHEVDVVGTIRARLVRREF